MHFRPVFCRITVFTLLIFTLIASPRYAAADIFIPCQGNNLLTALQETDPNALAELEKKGDAIANGIGRLWKIEVDGAPPSYLFGTIHYADERLSVIPEPVADVIRNARLIMPELDKINEADFIATNAELIKRLTQLPNGQTLATTIKPEIFQEIRNDLRKRGITIEAFQRLQPWMLAFIASKPPCEFVMETTRTPVLDTRVLMLAKASGVTVRGLETMEEQFNLFNSLPATDQLVMLRGAAKYADRAGDIHETMLALYQQGRIGLLQQVSTSFFRVEGDQAIHGFVKTKLLENRNIAMVERSIDELHNGNVVIAVGAGHLIDEKGLVALYREAGFRVTKVMQ